MAIRTVQYDYFGPRFAVIDGEMPSPRQLKRLRRKGLCVHVLRMPPGEHSLEFLDPVAEVVQELRVTDYACTDARRVERMPSLRQLGLGIDARMSVDLTKAEKLEMFAGPWKRMESVVDCVGLSELRISNPAPGVLDGLRSSLTRLDIFGASRLSRVPTIPASARLQSLTIFRAKSIDLAPLANYGKLRRLELDSCKTVLGATVLTGMANLEEMILEKCAEIDGWECLEAVRVARVRVIDRNPFDAEFRRAVAERGNWTFPPGRQYLPRGRHDR